MLAVIDTNVFVSGLLGSGICRQIFLAFKDNKFNLLTSEVLFDELVYVLKRPKFHLLIDSKGKEDLLSFIRYTAIFVSLKKKIKICRDAKDNMVIECAFEGKSDYIVSGDKDLLTLTRFHNIPIISPKEFLADL